MSLTERLKNRIPIIEGDANIWKLFEDPELFKEVLEVMATPFRDQATAVLGAESRGFIVGSAMAIHLNIPFVGVRKANGFFPGETISQEAGLDYRNNRNTFRIQADALNGQDKVFLVDDWMESGQSAKSIRKLVETTGAIFLGAASIVDQLKPERKAELGIFQGVITNTELFQGREQRDYQKDPGLIP